jgi:hypothetical protein
VLALKPLQLEVWFPCWELIKRRIALLVMGAAAVMKLVRLVKGLEELSACVGFTCCVLVMQLSVDRSCLHNSTSRGACQPEEGYVQVQC